MYAGQAAKMAANWPHSSIAVRSKSRLMNYLGLTKPDLALL
jgi:hypothetical protein